MNIQKTKIIQFVASKYCFTAILVLFLFSASWLATSSRYPMAFDEDYHLGLIELHTHEITPWFTHQPAGAARYSTLTRDPSYLYHYLMSFPYRLLKSMTSSQTILIVSLRLMNVVLFAIGIYLLRRLLLKTRASPAIINIALLFFVLTPVTPLLAAHINYDNLQFVLLMWVLLLVVQLSNQLKKRRRLDIPALVGLLSISLLGSLVKFTFLPFLTAVVVYVLYLLLKTPKKRKAWRDGWRAVSKRQQIFLGSVLAISTVLFCSTYGVNIVRYHNPIPQCNQVLSIERCKAYPPWNRNYEAALHKQDVNPNPAIYSFHWITGMFNRMLFTINGHAKFADNENHMAPIIATIAAVIGIGGVILFGRFGRSVLRDDNVLVFLLFVSLVYIAAVWGRNYHDYLQLGKIVAVNGRYLIPILPFIYVVVALCYQRWIPKLGMQCAVLAIVLLLFMQGGGITGFIHYSNLNWYWPENSFVNHLNKRAKQVVNPFFISL